MDPSPPEQDGGVKACGLPTLGPASSACAALRPPRRGQNHRRSGVVSYESTNAQENHAPVSSLLESTRTQDPTGKSGTRAEGRADQINIPPLGGTSTRTCLKTPDHYLQAGVSVSVGRDVGPGVRDSPAARHPGQPGPRGRGPSPNLISRSIHFVCRNAPQNGQ